MFFSKNISRKTFTILASGAFIMIFITYFVKLDKTISFKLGSHINHEYPFLELGNKSDRLLEQLNYVPSKYNNNTSDEKHVLILTRVMHNLGIYDIIPGKISFEGCPVDKCSISTLKTFSNEAPDAIIYRQVVENVEIPTKEGQVHIFFSQECPNKVPIFKKPSIINWTATYRKDSDIPVPYRKWVYYNNSVKSITPTVNYAANKTKKVAWVVSNCKADNNRLEYAKDLQNYIDVDIYGKCGTKKCTPQKRNRDACFNELQDYKFYLAFENSNCVDYITEKFFTNSLQHNMIPIAMGAPYNYYKKVAPHHSFLHVDQFASARDLAEYLHKLDQNDTLYNSYFAWKNTGGFLEKNFYCRLCALLHSPYKKKTYNDINFWFRKKGFCIPNSWNDYGNVSFHANENL